MKSLILSLSLIFSGLSSYAGSVDTWTMTEMVAMFDAKTAAQMPVHVRNIKIEALMANKTSFAFV